MKKINPKMESTIRPAVLHKLALQSEVRLASHVIERARIEEVLERSTDEIAIRTMGYVWAHDLTKQDTEPVPATWWDHLKQTLKARWPRLNLKVKTRKIARTLIYRSSFPAFEMKDVSNEINLARYRFPGPEMWRP